MITSSLTTQRTIVSKHTWLLRLPNSLSWLMRIMLISKAMVKAADFKYDQQSEKILKTLKEAAEFEGYMDGASAGV